MTRMGSSILIPGEPKSYQRGVNFYYFLNFIVKRFGLKHKVGIIVGLVKTAI